MAKKISALPLATSVPVGAYVPVVVNGRTVRVNPASLGLGFNGTELEPTDTPSVGHTWNYRAVDGKYRSDRPSPWFNVKDYGAVGDGSTDDTTAIQLAVAAVKAATIASGQGAKLHFPAGTYLCSSMLDFDSTDVSHIYQSITLYGDGGGLTGQYRAATTLIYTGDGNASDPLFNFISARGSAGFGIKHMAVLYDNASFVGTLVNFSHSAAGWDSSNMTLRDAIFASDGGTLATCANLVLLDGANCGTIDNCIFYGAVAGIRGIGGAGYTVEHASGQSNRILITGCNFDKCTLAALVNPPTQACVVSNCTFEGIAMPAAIASDFETTAACDGFRFEGNWCGDAPNTYDSTPWIDNNGYLSWQGATFENNFITSSTGAKDSIKLGPASGVAITGNTIETIDFRQIAATSYPQGIVVTGNYLLGSNTSANPFFRGLQTYSGSTYQTTNQINQVCIFGNRSPSLGTLDHLMVNGHIVAVPTLFTKPTVSFNATHVTATIEGTQFYGSSDLAGRITIVVGGAASSAGIQCSLQFAHRYDGSSGTRPKVQLTPENAVSAAKMTDIYVDPNFAGFDVCSVAGLAEETYVFNYHVIG